MTGFSRTGTGDSQTELTCVAIEYWQAGMAGVLVGQAWHPLRAPGSPVEPSWRLKVPFYVFVIERVSIYCEQSLLVSFGEQKL